MTEELQLYFHPKQRCKSSQRKTYKTVTVAKEPFQCTCSSIKKNSKLRLSCVDFKRPKGEKHCLHKKSKGAFQ